MNEAAIVVFFGTIVLVLVVALIWYAIQVAAYWKIFTKAGEAGWKSLIPFYNLYIQYKLTWNTSWFFVLAASMAVYALLGNGDPATVIGSTASTVISVLSIISCYKLSRAFGHGIGFAVGLIFLNPIFMLVLGFGESEYLGVQ